MIANFQTKNCSDLRDVRVVMQSKSSRRMGKWK
jgi:hypothetical protein